MSEFDMTVVDRRSVGAGGDRVGERSVALDVFRGICVAGMILVTDPGTYSAVYPQLLHATWHGATATDMIFPGFLFAVGAAVPLAVGSRVRRRMSRARILRGIARRSLLLIAIGLVLNAYPLFSLRTLRLPGVLQRIGLCYFAGAAIWLAISAWSERRRRGALVGVVLALLVGYGAMLRFVPVPGYGPGHLDTLRSLPAYADRAVFTTAHLWPFGTTPGVGVTFDPEGLLSTLPAIASVLVGVLAGEVLLIDPGARDGARRGRMLAGAALVGAAMVGCGLLLDPVMPIIKKLWTPSFALLSSGVALLCFVVCHWMIDVRRMRWGLTIPLVFGTNAIAAFALSGVLTSTLDVLRVDGMNWHAWGYRHLFLPWAAPVHASLLYAIAVVGINCGLVGSLYRRRVFLKL